MFLLKNHKGAVPLSIVMCLASVLCYPMSNKEFNMNNFLMRQLLFLCLDILLRNDRKSQRHFFFSISPSHKRNNIMLCSI